MLICILSTNMASSSETFNLSPALWLHGLGSWMWARLWTVADRVLLLSDHRLKDWNPENPQCSEDTALCPKSTLHKMRWKAWLKNWSGSHSDVSLRCNFLLHSWAQLWFWIREFRSFQTCCVSFSFMCSLAAWPIKSWKAKTQHMDPEYKRTYLRISCNVFHQPETSGHVKHSWPNRNQIY